MCLQLRGMEAHLSAALRINGALNSTWPDINVTRWPKKLYDVPRQSDGSETTFVIILLTTEIMLTN